MRCRFVSGFVAVGVMAFAGTAWAHHAHGHYRTDVVEMEGVVSEVHLLNPHSWVYLEVTKDGQREMWALEGTGGARLKTYAQALMAGDKIKVRCQPLSDGTRGCLLGFIKTADGVVKDWDDPASTKRPTDF